MSTRHILLSLVADLLINPGVPGLHSSPIKAATLLTHDQAQAINESCHVMIYQVKSLGTIKYYDDNDNLLLCMPTGNGRP